ncbi:hypothetical protein RND81_06G185100 [Saponaria officinalis]|uniref:protein-serine/threonine phosphatase n=1 Tax=Saponaria officinalis TaxID=3572 RepID=A0AAW1KBX3_SAPOF
MKEILGLLVGVDSSSKKQQCPHYAFVNNMCAGCKKPMNKCDNPIAIPFRYIDRNFCLSNDAISRLRDLNLQSLLHRKKLHLVLDLDNTLIHAAKSEKNDCKKKNNKSSKNDVYEILRGEMLVKLRPGARDFLKKASQLFDLSIYTIADEPYARQIAKILESDGVRFSRVVSREDCTKMGRKGLDVVLSHQRVVLIVDDLDEVWGVEYRGNVIKIQPFTFFQKASSSSDDDDQELSRVLSILKEVHAMFYNKKQGNNHASKDVRRLLENVTMVDSGATN